MSHKKNGGGANRPPNHGTPSGSMVGVVYHSSPLGASMTRYDVRPVEFPAVLVLSRWDHRHQEPVVIEDTKLLFNEGELELRLGTYEGLEQAGMIPYEFTLAAADEVDQVLADVRKGLEAEYRPWSDWVEDRAQKRAALNGTL